MDVSRFLALSHSVLPPDSAPALCSYSIRQEHWPGLTRLTLTD